jgi:hypothetical protein
VIVGGPIVAVLLIARSPPGSGAEQPGWRPARAVELGVARRSARTRDEGEPEARGDRP